MNGMTEWAKVEQDLLYELRRSTIKAEFPHDLFRYFEQLSELQAPRCPTCGISRRDAEINQRIVEALYELAAQAHGTN